MKNISLQQKKILNRIIKENDLWDKRSHVPVFIIYDLLCKNESIKDFFYYFLIHENILNEFIKYSDNEWQNMSAIDYIMGAFNWAETVEGYNFWNNQHLNWQNALNKRYKDLMDLLKLKRNEL